MNLNELTKIISDFIEKKDFLNAENTINQALIEYPNEAAFHYYKGKLLFEQNNSHEAISYLLKADQIKPDSKIKLKLCQAYLDIQEVEKVKTILNELEKTEFNNPELYYVKAVYHLQQMQESMALDALNELLKRSPNHLNGLELRAVLHNNLQNEEEALDDLTKILDNNPMDTHARLSRIEINKKLDNRKEIEEDYTFLIKKYQEQVDFRLKLGTYFMEIAEINEAIYVFSDCIEILENSHSDFSVALRKRAECYLKIGAFQKAVDDYNLLLKSKDQQASDFLGISEAFEELNKKDLALQYLNLGIDLIASDRWKLIKKLGQISLDEKNYEEAELAFKKMTFEDKGKADGFYQLGILYLKQGDVESAYEVLKEADNHFHEKAQDLISEYCQDFIKEDQLFEENERISEYLEFANHNSKSSLINKISGNFWLLNLNSSIQKNEILKNLDPEIKDRISASLEHLIFVITAFGWSIFKINQEGNRSVYKIIEESEDAVIIESSPFGTSFVQEMKIKLLNHQLVICNFGTESTVFDLYFDAKTLDDFSAEQKQTLENFIKTPAMSFMEGK